MTDQQLTMPVSIPADLKESDPMTMQGEDLVKWVQSRLLKLGYTDGGPADGSLNLKTQGTILDFRNRNGLDLHPGIDNSLISMLISGPSIELPVAQVQAETPQIAEKVEAVKETWRARFWAKVLGWPSFATSAIFGVIQAAPEAIGMIAPVKAFLTENLSMVSPLTLVIVVTTMTTMLAIVLWRKSANAETALVEGYRTGTVKNDVEPKEVGP